MIDAIQRKPALHTLSVASRAVEAVGRAILRYGLVLFLIGSGLASSRLRTAGKVAA